jgi:small subunit ribosomal protein S3
VANAQVKSQDEGEVLDVDELFVREAFVDEGPTLKRWRAAAQGRAAPLERERATSRSSSTSRTPDYMGQKTHPTGFRLGIVKDWKSRWYAERDFPRLLHEDETIRKYLRRRLSHAALAQIDIERKPSKIVVTLHTARPGVVIGKRGSEVDKLRDELGGADQVGDLRERRGDQAPEVSAYLVAENVAHQLRQRISFRRAMKRAVQAAIRSGAEGIKIQCAGRLGGAEIARTEGYNEGRVPLHTLRADIDYAQVTAFTTYGTVGVKCWIFKGEVIEERRGRTYSTGS